MYERTLADLISLTLEATDMGCMAHDWVEIHSNGQRAWALWMDLDEEERLSCHVDINYVDGLADSIDVFGIGPDGGKGAFYGSWPLL
jgi:hypothetical protein